MLVIVAAALLIVIVVMMMLVIVTAALFVVIVVVMMVVLMLVSLFFKLAHFILKCRSSFHSLEKLSACKLLPRSSNDNCICIVLLDQRNTLCDLLIRDLSGVAKHDTACIFDLVIEKLAEILHVHLALVSINNGSKSVKCSTIGVGIFNRLDNVGKLANTRRLDKDSIGCVFADNLLKCLCKVADKRAADTARVHFVDFDACLCKEAAVNSDLTEFVFDKNQLFAAISLLNQFFDKSGLSRTEKARKNINFSHFYAFLKQILTSRIITPKGLKVNDFLKNYLVPVDPNPPAPRTVSESSSRSSNSAA